MHKSAVHVSIGRSQADQRAEFSVQVTTLISEHNGALAQGPVRAGCVQTFKYISQVDHRAEFPVQVTTLISEHNGALAQGPVSELDVFKHSNTYHR